MEQTIKKAIKTGYGLGLLSVEQAKKVAGSVKRELHLNDEESRKLALELVKNSEQASKEVLKVADKYLEAAIVRTGVARKTELTALKKVLKGRLGKLGKLGKLRNKETIWSKVKTKIRR
ncbi:MAG: hypothetical protein AABX13_03450 [Nanoarchaeota archaeon]